MKTKICLLLFDFFLFLTLIGLSIFSQTVIYLLGQAHGQFQLICNTQSIQSFKQTTTLSHQQIQNLNLVEDIKRYSVDSLAYLPTDNFSEIVDQGKTPSLWVITASEAYNLKPYTWYFPIVGQVSYKGFFNKTKASQAELELKKSGYDTELRAVSAWSTLGWFSDPILSNTLNYDKGNFCNLLFHELFHATYYAPSSVNVNENLASFVAHKATLQFLRQDTASLKRYLKNYEENLKLERFINEQTEELKQFYLQIAPHANKEQVKQKRIQLIVKKLMQLKIKNKVRLKNVAHDLYVSKNAYFIGFQQYHALQDSLEFLFNKNYNGQLKKLVQHLRLNGINY